MWSLKGVRQEAQTLCWESRFQPAFLLPDQKPLLVARSRGSGASSTGEKKPEFLVMSERPMRLVAALPMKEGEGISGCAWAATEGEGEGEREEGGMRAGAEAEAEGETEGGREIGMGRAEPLLGSLFAPVDIKSGALAPGIALGERGPSATMKGDSPWRDCPRAKIPMSSSGLRLCGSTLLLHSSLLSLRWNGPSLARQPWPSAMNAPWPPANSPNSSSDSSSDSVSSFPSIFFFAALAIILTFPPLSSVPLSSSSSPTSLCSSVTSVVISSCASLSHSAHSSSFPSVSPCIPDAARLCPPILAGRSPNRIPVVSLLLW
mmetsp:Transcript_8255/g.34666  ORF Transcript_8255/g.34666 Transcript_8255/m.34666 type:complete len:319 (-) Transcript_8255:323-1279(-)